MTEKRAGDEWWFGGRDGAEIVIRPADGKPYDSVAVVGAQMSSEGVDDANARLMAAAPELLEACQELKQLLDMVLCVTGWLPPDANGPAAKALAAIAKATGESK